MTSRRGAWPSSKKLERRQRSASLGVATVNAGCTTSSFAVVTGASRIPRDYSGCDWQRTQGADWDVVMIGKLFVPLAVGGGLIFLLSSAASASPSSSAGSAPKNAFDQLPDNLRQLAGQAQATNNPDMLEQMASQLEARGFGESAGVLRAQATGLRQRSQNAFDQLPDNLKQMAGQAQATNDPSVLDQVATQLEAQGFREQPRLLRAEATALRGRAQGLVAAPSGASSPGIVPSPPSVAA